MNMDKWIVIDGNATTKYVDYGPDFEERDYYLIEIRNGDPDELEALANKVCDLLNAAQVNPENMSEETK